MGTAPEPMTEHPIKTYSLEEVFDVLVGHPPTATDLTVSAGSSVGRSIAATSHCPQPQYQGTKNTGAESAAPWHLGRFIEASRAGLEDRS